MPAFDPIQTSFLGGEVSPRLGGRVDTELYKKALSYCRNFRVLPHGPLLMRAGSWHVYAWTVNATVPRLFAFRPPGSTSDLVFAIGGNYSTLLDGAGQVNHKRSYLSNGGFDADLNLWSSSGTTSWSGGVCDLGGAGNVWQTVLTVPGNHYRVSFRAKSAGMTVSLLGGGQTTVIPASANWAFYHVNSWIGTGGADEVRFFGAGQVDDVVVTCDEDAEVPGFGNFGLPFFADAALPKVQSTSELAKSMSIFVQEDTVPWVLHAKMASMDDAGSSIVPVYDLYEARFAGAGLTGYPGVAHLGFQGRLWVGGVKAFPNTLFASRSGSSFDFTLGASAADAISQILSTKGKIRWVEGKKSLLVGTDLVEHLVSAQGGIITQSDFGVSDESSFSSAEDVQSAHIGDQAMWVSADKRKLRAINYYFQENTWQSRALTFVAEHLTSAGIRRVHFAYSPDPTIICELGDDGVIGCTYDRSEQVLAWWRLDVGAPIGSACVARSSVGDELWISVTRNGAIHIERIPLHEVAVSYLDAAVTKAVPAGDAPIIAGLDHLEGQAVGILLDGALEPDQVVAGGQVVLARAGTSVTIGLRYSAKGVTLKPEGGNPRGTAQRSKRRWAKVVARLNDSALPLINGERAADRTPSSPMDQAEPLRTGDVEVRTLGWDDDGVITVEQDLPFRTEILALYGTVQANEV